MTSSNHKNPEKAFEELFVGGSWPQTSERIGVMSADSLNRQWIPVRNQAGYLIATSRDGKAALLGRMCVRDDGKTCIEIVVRAEIEDGELSRREFWHGDPADAPRHAWRLDQAMQGHTNKQKRGGDR